MRGIVGDLHVIVRMGLVLDGLPFLSSPLRICIFRSLRCLGFSACRSQFPNIGTRGPTIAMECFIHVSADQCTAGWCTRHPFLGNLVTCELILFLGMGDEKMSLYFRFH